MKIKSDNNRQFLLTFFDNKLEYQVKEVNSFILVKNINGSTNKPYVSVFTIEKYNNSRAYLKNTLF